MNFKVIDENNNSLVDENGNYLVYQTASTDNAGSSDISKSELTRLIAMALSQNVKTDRTVTIVKRLTLANNGLTTIYKPGTLNQGNIYAGLKYNGSIDSLRLKVELPGLTQMAIPDISVLDSDYAKKVKSDNVFINAQKKLIRFFVQADGSDLVDIADVFLFNQNPFYYIDLLNYFGSTTAFNVGSDVTISCQMIDDGYGVLISGDKLTIIGSSYEQASFLLDVTGVTLNIPVA
jgi:hypothetical protein